MREIISDILSLGIRVPTDITGRKCGAGPAEGRALVIDGFPVNASIGSSYAAASPYTLQTGSKDCILCRDGHAIASVSVVPEPAFYNQQTAEGIDYRRIALLHGRDCLASTVLQTCSHWRHARQCIFCATELSLESGMTLARKTPRHLAEVAAAAKALDRVSHVVLTAGTGEPPGNEIDYLAKCAAAVKQASGLPVHVQFAPPPDLAWMDALHHAGVDTVGIHIESFDAATLARVAPAKARIGLSRYKKAWQKAVALFGPNQVSSFLIAGLGESAANLLQGSELMADLGVYPFVVPLRPIPGTRCANAVPPASAVMQPIYEAVAAMLQNKGLASARCKAGCVRCGACSALAAYERPPAEIVYHRARAPHEIEAALAIRREVFVAEQGMFSGTDIDENDALSIYIVAKAGETVAGTVRVYPRNGNGHWVGGRLAVCQAYRNSNVGAELVKEAVKHVRRQGCTLFTAHVQQQNVSFFERLGWKTIGPVEEYMGRPHQLMRAK
ncbi:MAG: MSMEG_0568 family radical SAM protein [Desulfobacteraceae bacterium]|nr:MAG: MSMEG_0568 family radical SAM protein [Desulfobacteraceae bacterium]